MSSVHDAPVPRVLWYPPPESVLPAARPREKPLASRFLRLIAKLLDVVILGIAYRVVRDLVDLLSPVDSGMTHARFALGFGGVAAFLLLQAVLLSACGQTLGKMAMGVRVVGYYDEKNPGFVRAVLLRVMLPPAIWLLPGVGALFLLLDLVSGLGDERRCLHDQLAETKVVQV